MSQMIILLAALSELDIVKNPSRSKILNIVTLLGERYISFLTDSAVLGCISGQRIQFPAFCRIV